VHLGGCTLGIKTQILRSKTFFKNRSIYGIMWINMVKPDRPQMAVSYGACALGMVDK